MKKIIYTVLAFSPIMAFAQADTADFSFLERLTEQVGKAVAAVIPIMFALALIYFFWGLIQFIRSAGDPKKAAEGKSIMIYGVIAIAVMASIYGLVDWLQTAVGVNGDANIKPPTVYGL